MENNKTERPGNHTRISLNAPGLYFADEPDPDGRYALIRWCNSNKHKWHFDVIERSDNLEDLIIAAKRLRNPISIMNNVYVAEYKDLKDLKMVKSHGGRIDKMVIY